MKTRKTRGPSFTLPVTKTIRDCQKNSLRDMVRLGLIQGLEFSQVEQIVKDFDAKRNVVEKNTSRRTYEVIRIMHYELGYGLKHTPEGKIFLVGHESTIDES